MTFHQTQRFNQIPNTTTTTQTSSFSTPPSSTTSLLSSKQRNNGDNFDLFGEREDYSETQFLKNSIANHTKYGSTAAIPTTHFQYVTHYVEPLDTLQGLALRYGCKVSSSALLSPPSSSFLSKFILFRRLKTLKSATNYSVMTTIIFEHVSLF